MKLSRSLYFLFFASFVIDSGFSQDNSIDSGEKVKKLKSSKKDTKDQKKLLQKAKVKLLKTDTKDDKVVKTIVQTTPTSTTTQDPAVTDAPTPEEINWRDKLRSHLLTPYKKNVHPVKNHLDTVRVDLGMALIHLNLDEMKSVLEVDGWMRLNWTDEYLRWDPQEFKNLSQIHFGPEEIWKPDIQLYNNADGNNLQHYGSTHFLVFHTGVVLWVPPAKFRSFCKIDLRLWPQEAQSCKLKFGSWTSHGSQIDLGLFHNMSSVERLNFYTENKEWDVLSSYATRNTNKYASVPETYPDVTFTFILQRSSPAYRAAIILPCLITMLLVVSSFLLPPSAGEKLTVNCISFLVCILFLLYFQTALPAMSDHIPLIVLFYSNTGALVGIAIVLNICCISLARERRYSGPPKWLRNFFSGFMGRILCLSNYYHQVSDTHQRLIVEMDDIHESPESDQTDRDLNAHGQAGSGVMRDWILVAAGIERFFFLIYTIAFALVSSVYM